MKCQLESCQPLILPDQTCEFRNRESHPIEWKGLPYRGLAGTCHWRPEFNASNDQPEEAWLALQLACLPFALTDGRQIPAEPGIVRRLLADDAVGATDIALHRLRAAGLRMPLQAAMADSIAARLWAAALVFLIARSRADRAAAILDPSLKGPVHA